MLNTNELAEYFDRHNLSPLARQMIERVRSSPPSRRVKSGTHNVACRYASRKMGGVIQAESHRNELPAVIGWEFDSSTHEYYDQPPRIKVSYVGANGRRHAHLMTPDFFLLQDDFVGWVECKTEEWLQARAREGSTFYVADGPGRWRCPPGEEYAASYGLAFKIRSSAETNWTVVRNAEFLADYLDERTPPADKDQTSRVMAVLDGQAWIRLKDLLEADHGASTDTIYKMIADGLLFIFIDRDLLTEPERTYVFRDKLSAEAYRIHLESSRQPALSLSKAVTIAPGESIIWDDVLWRIVNASVEDIYLEDANRVFTHLRRSVLEQLVKDGKVTGAPVKSCVESAKTKIALRNASPTDFAMAIERYRAIFSEPDTASLPPAFSPRTLRKWRALYRHAAQMQGSGFLGLLPRIHLRGNRDRKVDAGVVKIMDDVIDDYFAQPGKRTLVSCWGEARVLCRGKFPPPGEQAFRAQIRRRREYDLKVAREGEKAAYDLEEFQWHLERTTPRHGERPFEIGHIDHTELDLQFVGSRRGEPLGKAWLTLLIDAYTRLVVAWSVSFASPNYRSCMAVIRDCVRRHGRVPKYFVADKGSEFESIYFETLLAWMESHKKTRPGGKPRYGSLVERAFGLTNDAFIHNLRGNNQALQNPRRMSKSHDPRTLAVWTLPKFRDAFEGFLDRVHGENEHPALGISPKQAMAVGLAQTGARAHTLIPYGPEFVVMCLPTTDKGTAKVEPARGVKINYLHYWTAEFRDPAHAGKSVPVRYDPDDASLAFAWLDDHWAPCQTIHAVEFRGRSEREIAMATQEIRARFKRNGERRAITAERIAEYLRETCATEQQLLEHKRHQESQDAGAPESRPVFNLPAPSPDDPTPDDVWNNLTLKLFGDYDECRL